MITTWQIVWVRHAVALDRKDWTKADILRPLTPKGRREFEYFWREEWKRVQKTHFLWVFHSGYVRSLETAQILCEVAKRLGWQTIRLEKWPSIRPSSDPQVWWKHWQTWYPLHQPGTVVFVSHNPFLEKIWGYLNNHRSQIRWKKAAGLISHWSPKKGFQWLYFGGPY